MKPILILFKVKTDTDRISYKSDHIELIHDHGTWHYEFMVNYDVFG